MAWALWLDWLEIVNKQREEIRMKKFIKIKDGKSFVIINREDIKRVEKTDFYALIRLENDEHFYVDASMNAVFSAINGSAEKCVQEKNIESTEYEFGELGLSTGADIVFDNNVSVYARNLYCKGAHAGLIYYGVKFFGLDPLMKEREVLCLAQGVLNINRDPSSEN
ncbi:hypothetical protein FG445_000367 [Yersinia enterocolitica]|uniref:hypothetical protein n=1 Tax=Yersinia enterocolitica TaxID=630 RepID=UPI003133D6E4|nr:hypothetical protein [Yersinia enterocolitica]EKN4794954.1 hypothetical protein [Yersinia enterocolitica]